MTFSFNLANIQADESVGPIASLMDAIDFIHCDLHCDLAVGDGAASFEYKRSPILSILEGLWLSFSRSLLSQQKETFLIGETGLAGGVMVHDGRTTLTYWPDNDASLTANLDDFVTEIRASAIAAYSAVQRIRPDFWAFFLRQTFAEADFWRSINRLTDTPIVVDWASAQAQETRREGPFVLTNKCS